MASNLPPQFKIERFFARYEFNTPYLLCCSDAESLAMTELVAMADAESTSLWNDLKLGYTESSGHPVLKTEVARLHGVRPDDVVVLTPQEGIYIAMKCLVSLLKRRHTLQKLHVISTFPSYQSLYENTKTEGCDVDYWTPELKSDNSWFFSVERLKSLIRTHTKLLVVNFPHNPTGFLPSEEAWTEIINVCKEKDIFLFSDEMYRLTNNDGSEALQSACEVYERAASLFGMSKTFGLPGLRIGWVCSRDEELVNMMLSFKDYTTICCPGPSEILAIMGLRSQQQITERVMDIVKCNLDILDAFFADYHDIFVWSRPRAGTTAFVKIQGWLWDFCERRASNLSELVAAEDGVLILPGKAFDFEDQFFRVGFGRRNLPEVVDHFRNFLNRHKPNMQGESNVLLPSILH